MKFRRKFFRKMFVLLASSAALFGLAAGSSAADVNAAAKDALGIDVSNHNGKVDFKAVKSDGRDFAFVLATDGNTFTSDLFKSQYNGAGEAGLIRGAYHFARPGGSATKQADHFLKVANYSADGKSLPPVIDLENNPNGSACYGLNHKQMTDWIQNFVDRVKENTKRDAIIYTSPGFWQQCTGNSKAFERNPLWIAQWDVNSPDKIGGWPDYTFWQYSDSGQVAGVNGKVDVNRFNGDVAKLKQLAAG
jgi:GH25 family lysozyme M1 (1,4-beta-N-acetylmuramidase)